MFLNIYKFLSMSIMFFKQNVNIKFCVDCRLLFCLKKIDIQVKIENQIKTY
jgi:hypothetical protein